MGVKDRRARQKTLLRQQILDAARDLLVRDGYEKLSMRRVAERIDYSPTAIYLHFKDKQELVSSLCEGLGFKPSQYFLRLDLHRYFVPESRN